MPFHDSWKLLFPDSAWEHTAWPALPASDESEPRGQCVTRRSLVTSSRSSRIVKIDLEASYRARAEHSRTAVRKVGLEGVDSASDD